MHVNQFVLCGKIERIEGVGAHVRLVLSEAGPIKIKAAAEVRAPDLVALITSPKGFRPGDTVTLTGTQIYNEALGANIAVVDGKTGAIRLASAPKADAPVKPAQTSPQAPGLSNPSAPSSPLDNDPDWDIPF